MMRLFGGFRYFRRRLIADAEALGAAIAYRGSPPGAIAGRPGRHLSFTRSRRATILALFFCRRRAPLGDTLTGRLAASMPFYHTRQGLRGWVIFYRFEKRAAAK